MKSSHFMPLSKPIMYSCPCARPCHRRTVFSLWNTISKYKKGTHCKDQQLYPHLQPKRRGEWVRWEVKSALVVLLVLEDLLAWERAVSCLEEGSRETGEAQRSWWALLRLGWLRTTNDLLLQIFCNRSSYMHSSLQRPTGGVDGPTSESRADPCWHQCPVVFLL